MEELKQLKKLLIQLATELDLQTEKGNQTYEDLSAVNKVIDQKIKKYEKAI